MANNVTVVGGLQGEVELRFTNSGTAVANFTIRVVGAAKQGQERPNSYFDCVAWGQLAENLAESLQAKDRIIVNGILKQERWEQDGNKRSKVTITAYNVGPDLSYATATLTRNERSEGGTDF